MTEEKPPETRAGQKMRIYELAKDLDTSSYHVFELLDEMGQPTGSSDLSVLDPKTVHLIRRRFLARRSLAVRVEALDRRTQHLARWEDETYQQNFAASVEISDWEVALRQADLEWRTLMAMEGTDLADPEIDLAFVAYLRENEKALYARCRGRLEALYQAECRVSRLRRTRRYSQRAEELEARTEHLANWEIDSFVEEYARKHRVYLFNHRDQVEEECDEYFQHDLPFRLYVKEEHPTLYLRLTGRLRAWTIAERLQVERSEQPQIRPAQSRATPDDRRVTRKREAEERLKDLLTNVEIAATTETALAVAAVRSRQARNQALAGEGFTEDEVDELLGSDQAEVQRVLIRFTPKAEGENGDGTKGVGDAEVLD